MDHTDHGFGLVSQALITGPMGRSGRTLKLHRQNRKENGRAIPWGESLSVASLSSTDNNPILTVKTRVAW